MGNDWGSSIVYVFAGARVLILALRGATLRKIAQLVLAVHPHCQYTDEHRFATSYWNNGAVYELRGSLVTEFLLWGW